MTRNAAAAGAELGASVTTAVGTSSRGDGIDDGAAAVGKTDGAEWMDGKAEAGAEAGAGSTFSDDANPRKGGRGVTSPSSCFLLRFACGSGLSSIGESTSWRSSLLSTSPSYRRCEEATLLVRLGGMPSSAEITSCVRICGSCEVVGCGD
jgi:hypothetical protein